MTREEKSNLLNELLEYEEKNDIGNLTRADRREFQQWVNEALEQEPKTFKWCTDCKEYDQEKHCCHRWSKAIRNTVEEMKQEYIERDVLDKIRAEIKERTSNRGFLSCQVSEIHGAIDAIFDKYIAEQED